MYNQKKINHCNIIVQHKVPRLTENMTKPWTLSKEHFPSSLIARQFAYRHGVTPATLFPEQLWGQRSSYG